MLIYQDIDIFDAPIDILVHCCNCFCTMGSGIALEIKKRYPKAYELDFKTKSGDRSKLGKVYVANVFTEGYRLRHVVNLYGQYEFGKDGRKLDYEAFYCGLVNLKERLLAKKFTNLVIGFPYGIGCGLAGGSWPIVEAMIKDVFDEKFTCIICKKP